LPAVRRLPLQVFKRVARKLGAKPVQVMLAWLLSKSPVMLPISGTNSLDHLEQNAASTALRLSLEDLLAPAE
jgi:pyridoxine 4-dehydrogenase